MPGNQRVLYLQDRSGWKLLGSSWISHAREVQGMGASSWPRAEGKSLQLQEKVIAIPSSVYAKAFA